MSIKKFLLQFKLFKDLKKSKEKNNFKGSGDYWENRYRNEGNSGVGSYAHLAEFKADFLNNFVRLNRINTVMEFGCGDGNQLKIAHYPNYIGLDVSRTAINICHKIFINDKSKSFLIYDSLSFFDNHEIFKAELTLSLDVLYHLVEKEIFEKYLLDLFQTAEKYVIIYASDYDQEREPIYQHENRRSFSQFVQVRIPEFKLIDTVKNKYRETKDGLESSTSDFFVYQRIK